jgi:hypothetical protein
LQLQQQHFDHTRKRAFFSSASEVDATISEANKIKRLMFKESLSFEEWTQAMQTRCHR